MLPPTLPRYINNLLSRPYFNMGDPIAQALAEVTTEGAKFLDGGRSDETRQALIDKARALIAAAETPVETLLWNIWALVRLPLHIVQERGLLAS